MLRKIPATQARIGMYVQELGGSWLDHAFWRSSFLIRDAQQLERLAGAGEIVIDTDKGLDIAAEAPEPSPSAVPTQLLMDDIELPRVSLPSLARPPDAIVVAHAEDQVIPAAPGPRTTASTSFQEELARAHGLVKHSRDAMASLFADARMGRAVDARHCMPMVEDIAQSVSRNPHALISLSRLKTSDDYTYMHSVAVCALMVALARQLGMDEAATRQAGLGGLVHDIGKARMPLSVLNKPGALTPEEFAIIKNHPEAGHHMLTEGQGTTGVPLDVCLHHHEKINGTGYPHGLKGDQISLFARMGAVCDVYDAITSNRPYKAGWDPALSIQKMAQWAREGHFDERVFQAFVKSIGIYPTGSLVKLDSGLLAVVVEQGATSLLHPLVKVFYSSQAMTPVSPRLVDVGAAASGEQIVSRESPDAWGLQNIDAFWMSPQA